MADISDIAERLDLSDIFALRLVANEQLINLDGFGRGAGWAGNISIDPLAEPLISTTMATNEVVRHSGRTTRIFGPYWSDRAALVCLGDFVFVMGGPGATTHDDVLIDAAGEMAWIVSTVPTEKKLADELEVTQAALAVASLPVRTVDLFFEGLAETARAALACEFGAVFIQSPDPRLILAPNGWRPTASTDAMLSSLLALLVDLDPERPTVTQDLSDTHHSSSLGFRDGLVSRCVIPLMTPAGKAALVVAHSDDAPRGFTDLCQQVAETIGKQASAMLANAALVERTDTPVRA